MLDYKISSLIRYKLILLLEILQQSLLIVFLIVIINIKFIINLLKVNFFDCEIKIVKIVCLLCL